MGPVSDKTLLHNLNREMGEVKATQNAMQSDIEEIKGDIKILLGRKIFKFPIKISLAGIALGVFTWIKTHL
jgi:hypothetical protein